MKLTEIAVRIDILRKELSHWESIYADRRCAKCDNFGLDLKQGGNVCKLAGVRPPEEVLVSGCPEWTFDEIPF